MANFNKIIENILKTCNPSEKAGTTLLVLNALGMLFAAASNTVAAAIDKNTSAEDKKFLVPAGIVTGLANVGTYFAITKKMINWLEETVATKTLEKMDNEKITENAKVFIGKLIEKAQKSKKPEGYLEGLLKTNLNLDDTLKNANTKEILDNIKGKTLDISDDAINLYKTNFKSGFGVLGAFAGAIIGAAILTPIIRDVSAWAIQKMREKKNPELKDSPYHLYFDPIHVGDRNHGKPKPLTMKNYMAYTSNKLKI